jgi:hypothetical protein
MKHLKSNKEFSSHKKDRWNNNRKMLMILMVMMKEIIKELM